jgi:phospholipid/cholesterol/gamma-HCH transport system substrate-binding protein
VLLTALVVLLFQYRYSPPASTYPVEIVLGEAGSGLVKGSDVKARGVRIGQVEELSFEDGQARGVLRLDRDTPLPAPEDLDVAVTAKTLLGEKQVEIAFPDDRFGQEPFLAAGDVLDVDRQPTELNEVLAVLEPFLDAIDPEELATIIDTFAEQEGEAEVFGENLELTSELVQFGAATSDQTLDNLEDLADIAAALRPTLDADFDRIRAALPESTRILREQPEEIDTALLALSDFSVQFAELLEVEENRINRFLVSGDPLGEMLVNNRSEISSLLEGVSTYTSLLGGASGLLDDGTVFAYFRLFITEDSQDPVQFLEDHAP